MTDLERMKELVDRLDEAGKAYYQESREIMSNLEYDRLYDELVALEKKTGTVLAKSPTLHAGYEVLSELPKETHPSSMLSLDKTKDTAVLQAFLGVQEGLLSWKLDGLTIVLTYEGGVLQKAVTRGNGIVGEVVTPNARQFINLPARIPFAGQLVLRGEAVISYPDFNELNDRIPEGESLYKNPRNLCAGSVRQLNSEITAGRRVRLVAFTLVLAQENGEPVDFSNSRERQFQWLKEQGFEVVPYRRVTADTLPGAVAAFAADIETFELPSDGLVLLMDDIAYGNSLGTTAKFPRNAMAFKWKDEQAQTTLTDVDWSPSRTGLINPVAVFDPVELEGTTVSRASVHNVSIVESLQLGIGDTITVYKANMIIPQIAENLTRSGTLVIPEVCPVCGKPTRIEQNEDVRVLICPNPDCTIKQIKLFELFVSRNAMNIDGLSTATVEKLIDCGFIRSLADIYHLDRYREQIIAMEGFGEKSYQNMIDSIERSRKVKLSALIYALGIHGIGVATAKLLAAAFDDDLDQLRRAEQEALLEIDGIGEVTAADIAAYFADPAKAKALDLLVRELTFEKEARTDAQTLTGKTFVITGSVAHFANRDELKRYIEARGGKTVGSVSSKTGYLINNDAQSGSAKNRKARELGIPILTEEEFLKLAEGGDGDADTGRQ